MPIDLSVLPRDPVKAIPIIRAKYQDFVGIQSLD